MKNWNVPLVDLDYSDEEKQAVMDVLDRRWLTMGEVTRVFEEKFARMVGVNYAVATSNATVALYLACLALDIGPGDEVIVPSMSFVATANAVLYTGASVQFADIVGEDDLTISPEEIEKQITDQTKAIIVMHYGGYPCRMYDILEVADRHGLAVIEDAAHAPGASLDGRALGNWGEVGCFSFFSNKNMATGEGGMLVTNRIEIAEQARLLRSHGMTSLTWDRHQGHAYSYDVTDLGYNYRIDEIRSALGLVQLEKLMANNTRRMEITERYWAELEWGKIGLPFKETVSNLEMTSAHHIFPIILPEDMQRQQFMDSLYLTGVQTSIHYPPIHQFRYYRERFPGVSLPKTEMAAAREVTLPLFPTMTEKQISLVIDAVYAGLPVNDIAKKSA